MFRRYLFFPLLVFVVAAGCTRDRLSSPNVMEVPAYWQSQSQLTQNQFEEMRAFHEKESAKMSEDVLVFRNGEMERLAASGKELKKEPPQENLKQVPARSEKWTGWFQKKNQTNAPLVSEAKTNVR